MRVPEEKNCPLTFLQQVFAGKKKLFPTIKIIRIDNPNWPEFSNRKVWTEALKNGSFRQYIPDNWQFDKGGRDPEKKYTWEIICTLQPEWVLENLERIRASRFQYQIDNDVKKPADTVITPEWA